jgi:DNA replication and repair protein RecF
MWIEKLILRNFRNYQQAEISFCNGINMIQGENAQGKTNILEAFSLLSTGKSLRTPNLHDTIREGCSSFFIEAHFQKEGVDQRLSLSFDGSSKKINHNHTVYTSFISLLGIMPSVIITSEDISFIIGSPAERRRFIDMHIAQIDPLYVYHLGRYFKAMKQRNALLKQQLETSLSSWEQIMASAASYITIARKNHLKLLSPLAEKYMNILSESKDELSLQYQMSLSLQGEEKELATQYLAHWLKSRKRDFLLKSTLNGPHRDDIGLLINEKPAKLFGSEGQKWCFVIALRLAQRDVFYEALGSAPLIAIDDFGTHLDNKRNKALLCQIASLGQTFLTSPTPFVCSDIDTKKIIYVRSGSIIQAETQYDESTLVLKETS